MHVESPLPPPPPLSPSFHISPLFFSCSDADWYLPQSKRKYDHSKPFEFQPPAPGTETEAIPKYDPSPQKAVLPSKPMIAKKPSVDMAARRRSSIQAAPIAKFAVAGAGAAAAAAHSRPATPPTAENSRPTTPAAAAPAPAPEPEEQGPFEATLYYFNSQGRGEQVKLALAETGTAAFDVSCVAAVYPFSLRGVCAGPPATAPLLRHRRCRSCEQHRALTC